jgi:hypothetical protein
MGYNLREIVKTPYLIATVSDEGLCSASELKKVGQLVRRATGMDLEEEEIQVLVMAEDIVARHK